MSTTAGGFGAVGIVGCGLIGGSLALAARAAAGTRVTVTDHDPDVRAAAAQRGVGEVVATAEEVARRCDLVVLAVPVDAVAEVAGRVLPLLRPGAVLSDVGSVKSPVLAALEPLAAERGDVDVIGGHPMAGSERGGLDGADPTLFQGATYVLTPASSASAEGFNRLAAFLRGLGARVLAVDAVTHDRLVAVVSHLPQVVASSVMAAAAAAAERDPGLLAMAGGGFRDVTRVAGSDPLLWTGILRQNRAAVLDALDRFGAALGELRAAIDGGDWAAVERLLRSGRDGRALLPGKEVPATVVDLVIPVDDRPGGLAEVTTALGGAGINIEDLAMRHAEEGARGALVVAVAGEDNAERARQVLAERGFTSHLEPR